MVGGNGGNQFRQYARQNAGNLTGYNDVQNVGNLVIQNALQNPRVQNVENQNGLIGVQGNRNQNQIGNGHYARNCTVRPRRRDAAYLQTQLLIAQKEEAGIQLQAEEYDLMDAAADIDEIKEYTELLEHIPEPQQVPQNNNNVISKNLAIEVEKVNSINRMLKETNADLTTELARFKNQTRCFEISQEKYEKLERCYQQSVYQEQCLSKKINALHLSTGKQKLTLNEQILDLNKQLLKEKSIVSFLLEEKKRLKSDFKTREDELLDKQIQLEKRIKELNNILVKTGQSIHMLLPKPDSFYHTEQKMALGYQNPFYLKQAQKKQQSLYNGKVLLEKYDPPVVHDSEETLQLAQESREKMKQMNKEIKLANYTKINPLSGAKFVGDFKSIANKANASLAKHKALELEIERLLKAVVSQDIMNIMEKESVVDTSNLQTELERTKERFENCIIKKENEYAKLWNDWINPDKNSREETKVPNTVSASNRTKPITVLQPPIFIKKDVNSDLNGLSSTGVDNTNTRRLQPRSNSKHDRILSTSTSSRSKNKEAKVEEHHRNLLLYKNNKHISSACNNIKIDSQDVLSKVVCAMCKQCLISVNHDVCLRNYINGKKSHGKKQMVKFSVKENQMKYLPKVTKPMKVGFLERLVTPKPKKPRFLLRWSTTGRLFDQECKIVNSSESESQSDCFNGDNAYCSKHMTGNLKILINFVWKFMGTVRFGNDHVAAILGFGDLQWGNILITRVYFVEGLGHNLFSVGQLCDSDLEVAFRRNVCFVRNLEAVDLLKRDRLTNLYTINLHEMASASPICLMAHASSTKLWLWHQ
nr:integrase, catalytic region, zinc finger, CCHC-type, peptidase aspartic, catalytic [Tanacetum cinerariifolium]